ncbi:MAG: permease-like cell division protein FtsX [Patescibacteria group bacterium]
MFIVLKRVIKFGLVRAWRNRMVSVATIAVLVLTIIVIVGLLFFNVLTDVVAKELQGKVDISAYFNIEISEESILKVKQELVGRDEVTGVEYISREKALESFREINKDNDVIKKSLDVLEENPLEASLNIKVANASQYAGIVSFLESGSFSGLIDKINFRQKESVIMKMDNITRSVKRGGIILSFMLVFVAILVTFNTIRLTMHTAKEEIGIMRLVGASDWFIRAPFIVEGIVYGAISAIFALGIIYPLIWIISPSLESFLPGINLLDYLQKNLFTLLVIQFSIGILLGVVSSLVAIRKYLKV